ncbi:MAG: sugar kinase [Elusimicrobia bacterium]|nr:sugar kinase [Elusimicrobiota bacterium]
MDPILVVGSVALDSVKTPDGECKEALGGSAVYFSLAARLFAPVQMIGVVGSDFPQEHRELLESRGVDLAGLEVVRGKTFRWEGSYQKDFNSAKTLNTHLNVFEAFKPKLSTAHKQASVVFLANIDPELQWEVLSQMEEPQLVACDTMNYWISLKKPALKELLSKVDVFFVNEEEARKLTRESSNLRAARKLSEWGPSVVVIKKGEHGALLYAGGRLYAFPAYPVEDVKDPTGAGDTFAGGFLGYLAGGDLRDIRRVKRAMLFGSIMASFTVQDFSTRMLERIELTAAQDRYKDFLDLLDVGESLIAA